jgi:endoglucanase
MRLVHIIGVGALGLCAGGPAALAMGTCLNGVNLSGAESGTLPGRYGFDYIYPSAKSLDHFARAGMTVIRLPFRWERLQPHLEGPLDPIELDRLNETVALAKSDRLKVVLDPHNYAYYGKARIGSPTVPVKAFADFWHRLAGYFRNDPDVVFGLMNEPYDLSAREWLVAANAALAAIRETGARNLVLVPGTAYTSAFSWSSALPDANRAVMAGVRDPGDNFAFEVHQYFDANFSGEKASCGRAGEAIAALDSFTDWLRKTGGRGFLGEFGVSERPECLDVLKTVVSRIGTARDVWIGFAYWTAGEWMTNYMFSVQPTAAQDRPQLAILAALSKAAPGGRPQCSAMRSW